MATPDFFKYAESLAQQVLSGYSGTFIVIYTGDVAPAWLSDDARVLKLSADELLTSRWARPPSPPCVGVNMSADTRRSVDFRKGKHRAYYAKTAMFSPIMLRWERILYIDAKSDIHAPEHLHMFFSGVNSTGRLMANPDGFPACEWQLSSQFFRECGEAAYDQLGDAVKRTDYFQTTVMLFDTSIVKHHTMVAVAKRYHQLAGIVQGEQALFNVMFSGVYTPFPKFFPGTHLIPYDYRRRDNNVYIITAHRFL